MVLLTNSRKEAPIKHAPRNRSSMLFRVFGNSLCALLINLAANVNAHNERTLTDSQFQWDTAPQIKRTLINTSSQHLYERKGASHTKTPEGNVCFVAPYFLFDVDDEFAFDIDEDVTMEIVFDRSSSSGYNLTYDHAIHPVSITNSLSTNVNRWESEKIELNRARFANRKFGGTDFSITAIQQEQNMSANQPRDELTICSIKIHRHPRVQKPSHQGRLTVKVKDELGDTTSARMGIYTLEGKAPLPSQSAIPFGHFNERTKTIPLNYSQPFWSAPGRFIFYTDGTYNAEVPSGQYELIISKGPEYEIVKELINIGHDETRTIEINLKRWRNLPKEGWYSGDLHVHIARTESQMNNAVLLHSRAEDVHLSNLLQINTPLKPLFAQYSFGQ